MKNKINQIGLILIAFLFIGYTQNENIRVQSSDGKIQISIGINDSSAIYYTVNFEDSVVIQKSKMGLQLQGKPDFGKKLEIVSFNETKVNQAWNPCPSMPLAS